MNFKLLEKGDLYLKIYFFFQVHQRQTERMRHRSEWFLSDPTGLVTVKCRPSSMVMPVMSPSSLEPPSSPNPMSGNKSF